MFEGKVLKSGVHWKSGLPASSPVVSSWILFHVIPAEILQLKLLMEASAG